MLTITKQKVSSQTNTLQCDMETSSAIINDRRDRIPFWQRYESFLQKKDRFALLYSKKFQTGE